MSFCLLPDFAPDRIEINEPYTDVLINFIPSVDGYKPIASLKKIISFEMNDEINSIVYFLSNWFGSIGIIGTRHKLFFLNLNTNIVTDISKANNTYDVPEGEKWSFAVFGDNLVATHTSTVPQILDLTKLSTFKDLGGNPPAAMYVSVWGNFLVLISLANHPQRIMWSGLEDIEWWVAGQRNCDYQDFLGEGVLQGVTSSVNPIIFLRNAIYKGLFLPGSEIVFSFKKLYSNRGSIDSKTIVGKKDYYFFLSDEGWFQIDLSGNLKNITHQKIYNFILNSNYKIIATLVDPIHTRIYFQVKKVGKNISDQIFLYDWDLEKWSIIQISAKLIVEVWLPCRTLEQLDQEFESIDLMPQSFDYYGIISGDSCFGVIDESNALKIFCGSPMKATVYTQEMGCTNGFLTRCTGMVPRIDTEKFEICVGVRNTPFQDYTWSSPLKVSSKNGKIIFRVRARYYRFKMTVLENASWTKFSGYYLERENAGRF